MRTVSFRTDEDVEDDEEVYRDEVVEHVECPLGRMGGSGTRPNLSFILQRVRGGRLDSWKLRRKSQVQ